MTAKTWDQAECMNKSSQSKMLIPIEDEKVQLFCNLKQLLQTLRLPTIDLVSATGGCREYSARRGSTDDTKTDLSSCAA